MGKKSVLKPVRNTDRVVFTGNKKVTKDCTVFQIKAIKDFTVRGRLINKGDVGGYISKDVELEDSWVDEDSVVIDSRLVNSYVVKSKLKDCYCVYTDAESSVLVGVQAKCSIFYLAKCLHKSNIGFITVEESNIRQTVVREKCVVKRSSVFDSTLEDCTAKNCTVRSCTVNTAILDNSRLENINTANSSINFEDTTITNCTMSTPKLTLTNVNCHDVFFKGPNHLTFKNVFLWDEELSSDSDVAVLQISGNCVIVTPSEIHLHAKGMVYKDHLRLRRGSLSEFDKYNTCDKMRYFFMKNIEIIMKLASLVRVSKKHKRRVE